MINNELLDNIDISIEINNKSVCGYAYYNERQVCKCIVDYKEKEWSISNWFVDKEFNHNGIGKTVLATVLHTLYNTTGKPDNISYIWNGASDYVGEWISKRFDAISSCPIAVQKYQCDDDWESHIYRLNTDKVLRYFNINT